MADAAKTKASECPVCLDDYKDPRVLPACGHSVCTGCVQRLIDACPSLTTVACPECRKHSRIPKNGFPKNFRLSDMMTEMQAGTECTSCQRKAPLEDLFRCESCRGQLDQSQDVVLCGVCAMKHSMANKEHDVLEHKMASKRDVNDAQREIDHHQPFFFNFVTSALAGKRDDLVTKANDVAQKCETRWKTIRKALVPTEGLTREKLDSMKSQVMRLQDAIRDTQTTVRDALLVCNRAIAVEIEKCNRAIEDSEDMLAEKVVKATDAKPSTPSAPDASGDNWPRYRPVLKRTAGGAPKSDQNDKR